MSPSCPIQYDARMEQGRNKKGLVCGHEALLSNRKTTWRRRESKTGPLARKVADCQDSLADSRIGLVARRRFPSLRVPFGQGAHRPATSSPGPR